MMAQMFIGLKVLHDMKICHRDLKCANVFLNSDGDSKLGDFNVSKVMKSGFCKTQTGTPYYASPEVWKDKPYDEKSDIWSLGCVIYEMCALKPPFRAADMNGLFKRVTTGDFSPIPSKYSSDLSFVVNQMLQVQPLKRPSSLELLKQRCF
jgi:NIMA (never in mitosis gene a)-related kinase